MPVRNDDIAALFEEIADFLEIEGANLFRVGAYRNAARTLQELEEDIQTIKQRGDDITEIAKLSGIADDLAGNIREIVQTGRCTTLDMLQQQFPPAITELLKIPGLNPKRVKQLYRELNIHTIEQLQHAVRNRRIRALQGFGEKIESRIGEALESHAGNAGRFKLSTAAQHAEPLALFLRAVPGVQQVSIAGSYRREKETVGDVDILVAAAPHSPVPVMEHFLAYDEVAEVISHSSTRCSVVLRCNLQVDVRIVAPENYGSALHYLTGSKSHNAAMRQLGMDRGLKINEYGVFKGKRRIAGETEESVFQALGLPYIAPELRENRNEIEAAKMGRLLKLVEIADIKGDLHVHTLASSGQNTLVEMAEAAKQRGLEYLAITEHPRNFDTAILARQIDEIDRINDSMTDITLLKGIEVDIMEDGSLSLPDEILGRLDLVIGGISDGYGLSRARQTKRLLKAMDRPHFTILAHPCGRLIGQREPYDIDMPRVIRKAKERGCYLELNASPERLDLFDIHCNMAKHEGVLVSIDSDAYSVQDFEHLRFGVGQARRGWLEAKDVLNTRSLKALRPLLKNTM